MLGAPGEVGQFFVQEGLQAEHTNEGSFVPGLLPQVLYHADKLLDPDVPREIGDLGQVIDLLPVFPLSFHGPVEDFDRTFVGDDEPQHTFDKGGLPGTIRAQDRVDASFGDVEIHPFEHFIPAKPLMQVLYTDHFITQIWGRGYARLSGVNTGDTRSEKSIRSIKRLLSRIRVSGVRFTI